MRDCSSNANDLPKKAKQVATENTIEAVRNRKNQKLFIIVDDTLEARYKVINPAGEILILPDLLFDEDPIPVPGGEAEESFTPEQLKTYVEYAAKAAEQARIEASRPKPPPPRRTVESEPAPRKTARKVQKHVPVRGGLAAQWNAPRLTFYKNRIEPLSGKQSFRITVDGIGTFEMTKDDFLANFNDVVMSPSYRADGLYTYADIPDKVRRYQK